ncbi:guanine deaminase [Psychromonas algicola]|uniref:guanine deaminase n=1 Tax=Psychromonas algicola TaxID=2555642 RepID=UPI001068AFC9|nr:guanine deaminase [Psychromonas sp. RZ5]TEW47092.1 guanine deaminase [Psychromonas sp. RZ5]
MTKAQETVLVFGDVLDFIGDPNKLGEQAHRYFSPGALLIKNGKVLEAGDKNDIQNKHASLLTDSKVEIKDFTGQLILPGLIDTHIHFPQTEMIGAYGEQLLTWLEKHAFPAEQQFHDSEYATGIANIFIDELLRNGTTTALVFGTVHPQSVDAFFTEAQKRNLRMIAGKVMMDRNCPETLSDTAESGYQESKALIEKWHGVDRLSYAVTPRFAPTSTKAQLDNCGKLLKQYPDVYLHTHLSENKDECKWVQSLFEENQDYLSVYEDAGLVKKRAVFAHGIYLSDREYKSLADNQAAISHCPTSNLFIGSGLFNLKACEEHDVTVSMGTDVGGGTSFSLFQTFNEAYKIQQLQDNSLSAFKGLYLSTLAGAKALDLEGTIGNFQPGCEADFIVLDNSPTPFLTFRLKQCKDLEEKLFTLMMLGDDRCISETFVMGKSIYKK